MRRMFLRMALAFVVLCVAGNTASAAHGRALRQDAEAPLTNASVVKLVRAGFREKTLIAIINARPVRFDLSPERLIELKKSGVSEKVILAMLVREQGALASGDDWDDADGFFNRGRTSGGSQSGAEGSGTNIFGSSGGSRDRQRQRGNRGSGEEDTETSGSATVRIVRPPAETGGAAPKLEKTPTLTNQSVVELVEAGFSEGTIIRRIEQSPANFDLSPDKLAELRRRRVGEQVIAAMRLAMGEEGEPRQARPEN